MPEGIFISYRRDDQTAFTFRLHDELKKAFPQRSLFMDVNSIPFGMDFVAVLEREVREADVMLVVIGSRWLGPTADGRQPRIFEEHDFVRMEVALALSLDKWVIPVVVDNTPEVSENDLPPPLKPLARRHSARIYNNRLEADCKLLISGINKALAAAANQRKTAKLSEPARQQRPADAASANAPEPRSGRPRWMAFAAVAVTAAVIIVGVMMATADKETALAAAENQKAITAEQAIADRRSAEDGAAFDQARRANTAEAYGQYISRYPSGAHVSEAAELLKKAEEAAAAAKPRAEDQAAFDRARRLNTVDAYREYIAKYPGGAHAGEAIALRKQAEEEAVADEMRAFVDAKMSGSASAYSAYLAKYPNGTYATSVRELLAKARQDEARTQAQIKLDPSTIMEIQQRLAQFGYDIGTPDGNLGGRTRTAIAQWQRDKKYESTASLTRSQIFELLGRLPSELAR